jgi:hypothetical protein
MTEPTALRRFGWYWLGVGEILAQRKMVTSAAMDIADLIT